MARPAKGTISRRGERWCARITLPDGTRRNVPLPRHYTEEQAIEKARELTAYVRTGGETFNVDAPPTIAKLAERWYELRAADPDVSPSTRYMGRSIMRAHVLPVLGSLRPDDCGTAVLRRFVRDVRAKLIERKDEDGNPIKTPIATNTVRNIVVALTQFFEDVIAEEWIELPANPMKHPGVRSEIPGAVTRAHAADVIVMLDTAQVDALLAVPDPFWSLRHLLALTTGLRDGELAGLRWSDVDLDEAIPHFRVKSAIRLHGEGGHGTRGDLKTKGSRRTVPLHPEAIERLKEWHKTGWKRLVGREPSAEDPIFPNDAGQPYRPASARFMRDQLTAAGLPAKCDGFLLDYHAWRRTFASRMHAAGVTEETRKRLLGHAAASVTGKHYTHADLATLRRAVETTHGSRAPTPSAPGSPAPASDTDSDAMRVAEPRAEPPQTGPNDTPTPRETPRNPASLPAERAS